MEDLFDDIIFYEELTPERRAEVRAALEEDPELARAFMHWRQVRAALRQRLDAVLPDRRLLVLYALDETGASLSADERQALERARPDIERALDLHPGLEEAVARIQEDRAAFEAAWADHLAPSTSAVEDRRRERADRPPQRSRVQRSAPVARRWLWRLGVAAVVLLIAVVGVLFVSQEGGSTVVATGPDEVRTVELEDGSTVRLMADSRLAYESADAFDRTVTLEVGRAFFEVVSASESFVVETPTAQATVLGTSFGVRVDADAATEVVLADGQVQVASRSAPDQAVTLQPGQASRVEREAAPTEPTSVDVMDALAWTRLFIFRDTPMHVIAERLAQHYETSIAVAPSLRDEAVTGTFEQSQSLSDILQTIATTLDARVVTVENGYRIEADGPA